MGHDHDPVITTDPEGNYIRTSCRECGAPLDVDEDIAGHEADDETAEALTDDEFYETPTEEPA